MQYINVYKMYKQAGLWDNIKNSVRYADFGDWKSNALHGGLAAAGGAIALPLIARLFGKKKGLGALSLLGALFSGVAGAGYNGASSAWSNYGKIKQLEKQEVDKRTAQDVANLQKDIQRAVTGTPSIMEPPTLRNFMKSENNSYNVQTEVPPTESPSAEQEATYWTKEPATESTSTGQEGDKQKTGMKGSEYPADEYGYDPPNSLRGGPGY